MNRKYSKVVSLLGTTLLTISLLTACGQGTKDVTVKEDTPKKEDVKTTKKTEKPKQSKLGSRTNPVLFKKTATVDDELYNDNGDSFPIKFDLTVEEVVRGDAAYAKLKSMNEFNDPAPVGYEWILTKVKVKFVKSATEDLAFNIDGIMNFKVVSESGDIYSGDVYGTTNPDFSYEMYVGNEKEGYIANLVKTGEKAQLRYVEFIGGQVFFNLQ
ncbi:hypothetical protein [Bacillus sp. UNCCL81]|uniref:hypothetical protein n=1 Tax=Bacillus sp. UNCCL81 TaxID=1502755 RepID=UPI0008E8AC29|nr:hypothetical protein [Bacillus sp. UNCCL81]SFC94938.1 hypothetical protein SAMN02799633_02104 [Bacillus sp. UNCCL81]